jgi:hypothetical protein
MPERLLFLVFLLLSAACGDGTSEPAADPLDPFFRQVVGPPCGRNADCATGLCDRLLLPGNSQDEAQGACSSVPFAIFPWQRALLAANITAAVGDDPTLRTRVLIFAAGALRAPDAPISLRLLALELTKTLLDGPDPEWEALLATMTGEWSLPPERLLATVIRAGRRAESDALSTLTDLTRRGPEGHRIRAARELAALCLPGSVDALVDLATSRESRFLRDAVVMGVEGCQEPLRGTVLAAAAAEAMPYERGRFLILGAGGAASAGESTAAD